MCCGSSLALVLGVELDSRPGQRLELVAALNLQRKAR